LLASCPFLAFAQKITPVILCRSPRPLFFRILLDELGFKGGCPSGCAVGRLWEDQ
jgi:hypothetical protein